MEIWVPICLIIVEIIRLWITMPLQLVLTKPLTIIRPRPGITMRGNIVLLRREPIPYKATTRTKTFSSTKTIPGSLLRMTRLKYCWRGRLWRRWWWQHVVGRRISHRVLSARAVTCHQKVHRSVSNAPSCFVHLVKLNFFRIKICKKSMN